MQPLEAALVGRAARSASRSLSISISLVAVFIPILLMGGIVGRLFREFAVTLSVAIVVSLVVSLTTTPMMCATLLRPRGRGEARPALPGERAGVRLDPAAATRRRLAWVLRHQPLTLAVTLGDHGRDDRTSTRWSRRASSRSRTPAGMTGAIVGRPGHLVPGDAGQARRSSSRRHGAGPGGRQRQRRSSAAGRRTPAGMFVALKPLGERKRDAPTRSSRGLRGEARARPGRDPLPAGGPGRAHRRAARRRAVPVHAAGRQLRRAVPVGAARAASSCASCRSSPTSTATSRTRACRPRSTIDRDHGVAARHHARR